MWSPGVRVPRIGPGPWMDLHGSQGRAPVDVSSFQPLLPSTASLVSLDISNPPPEPSNRRMAASDPPSVIMSRLKEPEGTYQEGSHRTAAVSLHPTTERDSHTGEENCMHLLSLGPAAWKTRCAGCQHYMEGCLPQLHTGEPVCRSLTHGCLG